MIVGLENIHLEQNNRLFFDQRQERKKRLTRLGSNL